MKMKIQNIMLPRPCFAGSFYLSYGVLSSFIREGKEETLRKIAPFPSFRGRLRETSPAVAGYLKKISNFIDRLAIDRLPFSSQAFYFLIT